MSQFINLNQIYLLTIRSEFKFITIRSEFFTMYQTDPNRTVFSEKSDRHRTVPKTDHYRFDHFRS